MTQLRLTLEVYDGTGTQRFVRVVASEWAPRKGENFLIEDGLTCEVKDVAGRIDGTADIHLRLREPVGDSDLLCQHLLSYGWQRGLPPEAIPMRRNI
jgi:hypothetical protein